MVRLEAARRSLFSVSDRGHRRRWNSVPASYESRVQAVNSFGNGCCKLTVLNAVERRKMTSGGAGEVRMQFSWAPACRGRDRRRTAERLFLLGCDWRELTESMISSRSPCDAFVPSWASYGARSHSFVALWVPSGRIEQPETAQLAVGGARSYLGSTTAGPDLSWPPRHQIRQTPEMGQAVHQSRTARSKLEIDLPKTGTHPHRKLTVFGDIAIRPPRLNRRNC